MTETEGAFRKVLAMVVSAICKRCGFEDIEKLALETIVEILTSYIAEGGSASKLLAEASGRTDVIPLDINLALSEMGFNFFSIIPEAQKQLQGRIYVPPPKSISQAAPSKVMKVGKTKSHPGYIPDHLPAFPDPHTYVNTGVTDDPDTNYQQVREAQAEQKRNIDISLINFMLKIHPSDTIFPCDNRLSLIVPEREEEPPYVSALLPEGAWDSTVGQTEIANQLQYDNPFIRQPRLPLRSSTVSTDFV